MLRSVALLGSSSGRNAGDAALLSSIMDSIDISCGRCLLYEIPTANPEFVWRSYENRVRPVGLMPWHGAVKFFGFPTYRAIMRSDISLVFDAVLFDRALFNPLFNFLSTLRCFLPAAKRKGKRMGFYNVTAGPVTTPRGREMLRVLAESMDFITVRDQSSADILRELGVTNPNLLVTADAALNTKAANPARVEALRTALGLLPGEEVLALNVNPYLDTWADAKHQGLTKESFVRIYAAAVTRIARELGVTLLFVATQHRDVSLTREIMARVTAPKKVFVSNVELSHHDIKGLMAGVSLLFAMRVHAIILSTSALTPAIGLNYLPKVDHYFRSLGLEDYNLGFQEFSEDRLVEHLRKGWEDRRRLRQVLESTVPRLQNEANKAAELVRAIDEGEEIGAAIRRLSSGGELPRASNV